MSITHEQMSAAIDQAKEALDSLGLSDEEKKNTEVTVEIKSEKFNDSVASLEVPSESLLAASESNTNLKLTSEVGSMTISKDVSKNLSDKGNSVSVSMSIADKNEMTSDQKATVGDRPVYSLKAVAGGESIHELGGVVTISVKYTLKPGDDPQAITVYYVNDQGVLSKQVTKYDPATHTLTFITDHFSYFMVSNSASLDITEQDGNGTSSTVVIAAIAAIVVIAVAAVVVKRRL